MKKLLVLILINLININFSLKIYSFEKTFGEEALDVSYSIDLTDDNGFIMVGYTTSYGAGGKDVLIIKVDSNGNCVWSKTFGGSMGDYAYSVEKTSDGYIIAGDTTSYGNGGYDAYLIKVDSNGDCIWSKTFGGDIDELINFAIQTTDGSYILAGFNYFFIPYIGGDMNVYIVKVDSNGDCVWSKTFGGDSYDYANSVVQTDDNGFLIAGSTNSYGSGSYYDIYIIKVDSNGNCVWSKTYGGNLDEQGEDIKKTNDNNYIIVGETDSYGAGNYDVYLIKVDSNGNCIWSRTYGGDGDDYGYSVIQTDDGGYLITGRTNSFGYGGYDVYLIKTDSNGICEWSKVFGGINDDSGNCIKKINNSEYIIAGNYGLIPFSPPTIGDFYLIKTNGNDGMDIPCIDFNFTPEVVSFKNLSLKILGNYPNPFKERTCICYELSETANIKVKIFTISGEKVKEITGIGNIGKNIIIWDGKNFYGKEVSPGIYIYTIEATKDNKKVIKESKLAVLK